MNINIDDIVNNNQIVTGMMEKNQIKGILDNLKIILDSGIEGDIVELGCNVGTTSVFIRRLLDIYKSKKKFHVYDSWEGLPEKTIHDKTDLERQYYKGDCKTSKEKFISVFNHFNLELPIIHSGWFSQINDEEYPEKICFAFYDGDFYTSIIDSLNKTFHKIVNNGIIIIDDCGWSVLPGAHKACKDFLKDKLEYIELTGYPDKNGVYGENNCGGKIIKGVKKPKIAILISSTSNKCNYNEAEDFIYFKHLDKCFVKNTKNEYSVFLGYDEGDKFFEDNHDKFSNLSKSPMKVFKYKNISKSNPCYIWNKLYEQAYNEDFDYFLQMGDDNVIYTDGWDEIFIKDLKKNDGLGVTGFVSPFKKMIITAFVSKKHYEIFGYLYPEVFKNFYSDDWLDRVYKPNYTYYNKDLLFRNLQVTYPKSQNGRYIPLDFSDDEMDKLIKAGKSTINKHLK